MRPYVKLDGYPKTIECIEQFKNENEQVLGVWIRVDGYTEAFNQSIEEAESYAHEIFKLIDESSNSYRQTLRLDERNFLLLVVVRKTNANKIETNILRRLDNLPPFSFVAPTVSRILFESRDSAEDVILKLKYGLKNEWDIQVDNETNTIGVTSHNERVDLEDIRCFFQPIYWISNRLRGFEVLARWEHPLYGILEPNHFLSTLIKQGDMTSLFFKQLDSIEKLIDHQPHAKDLWFSLNIVEESLAEDVVFERLKALRQRGLNLELELEVCKSNINEHILLFQRIRGLGVRISINGIEDIHGRFIPDVEAYDTVKLAPRLVKQLTHGDDDTIRMLKAWIDRFVQSNKLIIANGIQARRAIDTLVALQVDALQGFAIKVPMSFSKTESWLAHLPKSLLFKDENNVKQFPKSKK